MLTAAALIAEWRDLDATLDDYLSDCPCMAEDPSNAAIRDISEQQEAVERLLSTVPLDTDEDVIGAAEVLARMAFGDTVPLRPTSLLAQHLSGELRLRREKAKCVRGVAAPHRRPRRG
jgi:hypothetical protein